MAHSPQVLSNPSLRMLTTTKTTPTATQAARMVYPRPQNQPCRAELKKQRQQHRHRRRQSQDAFGARHGAQPTEPCRSRSGDLRQHHLTSSLRIPYLASEDVRPSSSAPCTYFTGATLVSHLPSADRPRGRFPAQERCIPLCSRVSCEDRVAPSPRLRRYGPMREDSQFAGGWTLGPYHRKIGAGVTM